MDASKYPITQGYGYDPSYPLNNGWHRGIDYGCPTGTPIIVNGVTIGLSGNTGAVTGPHLHVGRFQAGQATDPGVGGGFTLTTPVVYDTGFDTVNGNFVRVNGSGALWVYLHLSQINVKAGQRLEGNSVSTVGETEFNYLFVAFFGPITAANPVKDSDRKAWVGTETNTVIRAMQSDPRFAAREAAVAGQYVKVTDLYIKQ